MEFPSFTKSAIIGASIIITALILGAAYKNRFVKLNSINVTGLGSKDFISDEIYWSGSYSAKATDAKEAYTLINAQKEKVIAFFKSKGFTDGEINLEGVSFEKNYRTIQSSTKNENDYNSINKTEQIFDGYTATQTIYFTALKDSILMKKIESVTNSTAELINQGVEFQGNSLQYTYSDLPSLKHSLIESASKDARERALKIVKAANGDLGNLKDASMGVFQITGKGEQIEDSYGGNFDTKSKEKSAKVTVKLIFTLD